MAVLLGIFFIVMAILLAGKVHPSHLHQHAGVGGITVALALTLSAGGLGWAAYGADYSRYLPRATSRPKTFWAVTIGGMVPQMLLMILGAAVATTVTGASSEISGLPKALPGWFVVPYLILAIISLYAVNTIDLYSSGLNLQAIGIKIKRWQAVCVDLVICTALLFPVIFSNRFNSLLSDFLLFGLVWISPWIGIVLTDWALRRGHYHSASLFQTGQGLYWRNGGIHWPAAVAQAVGIVGSAVWLNASPAYAGPLSRAFSGSDFDIVLGGGVAALIYWVLARRAVREEAAASA
jgi:nucleobase:cation symporter-1, NCS1 family